jgi:hypothetical protein
MAKVSEFPDHSQSVCSLRLFTHRWASFLVANLLVQNHPDRVAHSVRDCPDGFLVS